MKKMFRYLGMIVMMAIIGVSFFACDTGNNNGDDDYTLQWAALSIPYDYVIEGMEGYEMTAVSNNWAMGTGDEAERGYAEFMSEALPAIVDDGEISGSFEECVNFSLDGISAPADLKTATFVHKDDTPILGVFNDNYVIVFYLTKD